MLFDRMIYLDYNTSKIYGNPVTSYLLRIENTPIHLTFSAIPFRMITFARKKLMRKKVELQCRRSLFSVFLFRGLFLNCLVMRTFFNYVDKKGVAGGGC